MARVFRTVIRIITCIALIICPMPEKKCEAEFNGTFLQSWMSSSWDDGRWQEEIGAMKEAGIKYLIIQDVVHRPPTAHGPSTTTPSLTRLRTQPSAPPMLLKRR